MTFSKRNTEKVGTVFTQLHVAGEAQKQQNLSRLADYIKATYWLIKEEIAHSSKYVSLLELTEELDGSGQIRSWHNQRPLQANYRSHDIPGEFLTAITDFLLKELQNRLKSACTQYVSVLADEGTDLRGRTNLSVCIRYLNFEGKPVEMFIGLKELANTEAVSVKDGILQILENFDINSANVIWLGFDGASNMAGKNAGTQALLIKEATSSAVYVHCRSHLLQLICVHATSSVPEVKKIFCTLNSLFTFLYNSPKNHRHFKSIQILLDDPQIELVRASNTRWTSHARCLSAVVKSLDSVIVALQHIYQDSADLACEAGGILLVIQSAKSVLLIHALKIILQPLFILGNQLQSPSATLDKLADYVSTARITLKEIADNALYIKDAETFLNDCSCTILERDINFAQIHQKIIKPYINILLQQMDIRFSGTVMEMCTCTSLFNPRLQTGNQLQQLHTICEAHPILRPLINDCVDEFKVFKNYLLSQCKTEKEFSITDILHSLASSNGVLKDTFPALSQLAVVILLCPLGTPSVERSFSAMNRIETKLRQRLKVENVEACMLVSIEGPAKLTAENAEHIVRLWHRQKNNRRIQI